MNYQQQINITENYQFNYGYQGVQPVAPPAYGYVPQQVPAVPLQPVLTYAVHQETTNLLYKAQTIAYTILPPVQPVYQQPYALHHVQPKVRYKKAPVVAAPVVLDFSDRSFRMFNHEKTEVHNHYYNGAPQGGRQRGDRTGSILAGVVGLITVLVGAFYIGKTVSEKEELEEETLSLRDLKVHWMTNQAGYGVNYQQSVNGIIDRAERIMIRKESRKTETLALIIFGVGAGGMLFLGSALMASGLIIAGMISGAAAGGIALYKVGRHLFSNRDRHDAQAILAEVNVLAAQQVIYV